MFHLLLSVVSIVLWVLEVLVVGRVVAGWFGVDPNRPIVKAMHAATEPLFTLVRPLARKIPGPLDWTPALVMIGLEIVRRIL